jgi:3-hydroxybutyryl-CoA dehydrogenase
MTDTVGVLGAGLMGREIALVFALAGHPVILTDRTEAVLDAARARLAEIVGKGIARGLMPEGARSALPRIATATDPAAIAPCAFVTEAVYEDEGVKAQVLAAADAAMAPEAILATNTSTIPISVLAAHLRPERRPRFIGTHYFSPASRMKLVCR